MNNIIIPTNTAIDYSNVSPMGMCVITIIYMVMASILFLMILSINQDEDSCFTIKIFRKEIKLDKIINLSMMLILGVSILMVLQRFIESIYAMML